MAWDRQARGCPETQRQRLTGRGRHTTDVLALSRPGLWCVLAELRIAAAGHRSGGLRAGTTFALLRVRPMIPSLLRLVLIVLCAACTGSSKRAELRSAEPRLVSILVEVYDPTTNLVWQNVGVRIVEAWQEWSGCIHESPYLDWFLTDANGRVLLDEYALADAAVGFQEDRRGRALLAAQRDEDEATVLLEVDALGFMPVYVEVALRWDVPDVYVEVPFF